MKPLFVGDEKKSYRNNFKAEYSLFTLVAVVNEATSPVISGAMGLVASSTTLIFSVDASLNSHSSSQTAKVVRVDNGFQIEAGSSYVEAIDKNRRRQVASRTRSELLSRIT